MSSSIFRFVSGHNDQPEVTERLARVAHATVDRFAERAAEMEQDLRARASLLGTRTEKRARAALSTQLRGARGYVRKQPLSGVGIAMAAGIVIGGLLLLRR